MDNKPTETLSDCVSQKRKAKLKMVARIAKLVRAEGWATKIGGMSVAVFARNATCTREEAAEVAQGLDCR